MKTLEAWLAQGHSDEDGPPAVEGDAVILRGGKEEIRAVAAFLAAVAEHLEDADSCHMHLRDHMPGWSKGRHADLEVSVE